MLNTWYLAMTDELLGNSAAAQFLHEQIADRTPEQWALWLQNNRNQARRVSYRIPFERMAGGVFYLREELANFVEWEKSRQLGTIKLTGRAAEVIRAFGIGTTGGSTTGRKLNVTGITPQINEATGNPFVQVVTDDPLMVYRLELDEARQITADLLEAIAVCERAKG